MSELVFGWRTAILAVVIVQLLCFATALVSAIANRTANRTLAALLVVLSGILTPWMIGFAGFYDAWRWLTFAPFAITLAVAPLLWLYTSALIHGRWPDGARKHLVPPALQFLFLAASFALPLDVKWDWYGSAARPFGIVTGIGTAIGLGAYGLASLRMLRAYQARLAAERSDDSRYAAQWLSRPILASLLLLPVWAGYAIWDLFRPLDYSAMMGLHVVIAAFALYLAAVGWRHASTPFPHFDQPVEAMPTPTRDWAKQGTEWEARVRAEGWALDPELSLPGLARYLGTNSSYVSRALNEGLGVSFSAFVNGLRSEEVARALDAGSQADLLDLALDAGFASKASFNRSFRARFGMAPSAYRRRHGSIREKSLD